jgi:hypothetical protein
MTFFATSASSTALSLARAFSSVVCAEGTLFGAVVQAVSLVAGTAANATPPRSPAPRKPALAIATAFERMIDAAFISFSQELPARRAFYERYRMAMPGVAVAAAVLQALNR